MCCCTSRSFSLFFVYLVLGTIKRYQVIPYGSNNILLFLVGNGRNSIHGWQGTLSYGRFKFFFSPTISLYPVPCSFQFLVCHYVGASVTPLGPRLALLRNPINSPEYPGPLPTMLFRRNLDPRCMHWEQNWDDAHGHKLRNSREHTPGIYLLLLLQQCTGQKEIVWMGESIQTGLLSRT